MAVLLHAAYQCLLDLCTLFSARAAADTATHYCCCCCWLLTASSCLQQQVEGLNVLIVVERFSTRWVLSALFPIMATTWLGFLVFLLPRDDMGGRLGELAMCLSNSKHWISQ
jgi:hypothetical protein